MSSNELSVSPVEDDVLQKFQVLPVVLDLGKTKKKLIKALKHGEGPLLEDVAQAVEAVRENMGEELDGKVIVPVVIVYEKKQSRARGLLSLV